MTLALFDLDNTLLGGDSDVLWGEYLVHHGIVDPAWYAEENRRHHEAYEAGTLDIDAFLAFALKPLANNSPEQLQRWRREFVREYIEPILLPAADDLLQAHRKAGHELVIITATNSFITRPIADLLGVPTLLATEPEMAGGRFTGGVSGVPCFREGKVTRLRQWLNEKDVHTAHSVFYSDSHNDLPLLHQAGHAVAVDPDPVLSDEARQREWPIITLRQGPQPRHQASGEIWQP